MTQSSCKRLRSSSNSDVDAALLEWFKQSRSSNVPISGPILLEKAGSLAEALGVESFKATTGFLDRWKKRHGIVIKKMAGEEKSVSEQDVRPWIDSTLPELLSQYLPEDIYNVDETGLFYKLQPDKSLTFKGEKCSGGKKPKDRLTVLVGASMTGEKLPLLVIGKSKSPRCFAGVRSLPLQYTANTKAWMTSEIFTSHLEKWNRKLHAKNHHVLLILDNCPAHPHTLCNQFSNITLQFLPPNTTAKLQPCDQGIIQSLKVHYRHKLVRKLLLAVEAGENLKISVLDAMLWLKTAWNEVTPLTIQNCFRHCGFNDSSSAISDETTVIDEPDIEDIVQQLSENGVSIEGSVDDYINADEDVAVAGTFTDAEIAANIRGELDMAVEEEGEDEPVVCPTLLEFQSAIDVTRFVICHSDDTQHLTALNSFEKLLFNVRSCNKQTEITDFFQPLST